jgi:hypothetical protein
VRVCLVLHGPIGIAAGGWVSVVHTSVARVERLGAVAVRYMEMYEQC